MGGTAGISGTFPSNFFLVRFGLRKSLQRGDFKPNLTTHRRTPLLQQSPPLPPDMSLFQSESVTFPEFTQTNTPPSSSGKSSSLFKAFSALTTGSGSDSRGKDVGDATQSWKMIRAGGGGVLVLLTESKGGGGGVRVHR